MKRLLVSLRVWMVFLMNWVTPDRTTSAAAVYSAQRTYQRKAAMQAAGLVSFYEWRMAVNDEEKQKAKAAALYKRRCLQAFKESPKQERAGPHLYMEANLSQKQIGERDRLLKKAPLRKEVVRKKS